MSAKDKATGKDQSITIAASSGLSDKEIESMLSEAEANRERDQERKAVIEQANSADSVCAETTKAMDEFKDAIDASEKEKITALMTELRELALKGQAGDGGVTADSIREKVNEVQQASLSLFKQVYEKVCRKNADPG